jgi:hypothetical protein
MNDSNIQSRCKHFTTSFLLSFLILAFSPDTFGQQDTIIIIYPQDPIYLHKTGNDTLIIDTPTEGNVLFGTTIIPTTSNQVGLYGAGLWLDNLTESPCNSSKEPSGIDKILGLTMNDSILSISMEITSNCCHKFLGDAELVDNSILNLIYIGYGGNCACYCCFGLDYTFRREHTDPDIVITHVMINGDRTSITPIKY